MSADSPITPANVLVIDDEREHAQVMCEALSRQGHKCDITYNVSEAQSRLDKKRFDVIVTDMVMDDGRDGLEVLRLSKELNPPPPLLGGDVDRSPSSEPGTSPTVTGELVISTPVGFATIHSGGEL